MNAFVVEVIYNNWNGNIDLTQREKRGMGV